MAVSKTDVTRSYTEFSQTIRDYLVSQGDLSWSTDRFTWFRPKDFEDPSDLEKVSEVFSLEELNQTAEDLLKDAGLDQGNIGDYAVVAMQTDALVAANKSFESRHRSKLRHMAVASGVSLRTGEEHGTFHYIYDAVLANLRRQASRSSS